MPSSYLRRLNETSNLIKKNNQIAQQILDHSLAFHNIPFPRPPTLPVSTQVRSATNRRPHLGRAVPQPFRPRLVRHRGPRTGVNICANPLNPGNPFPRRRRRSEGQAENPRARSRPRQIGVRDKRARVHHRRKRVQLLHVDGAQMGAITR